MPRTAAPALLALLLLAACAGGGGGAGVPAGEAADLARRCELPAALAANDAVIAAAEGERYAAARRFRAVLLSDMDDDAAAAAAVASVASETRTPERQVRDRVAAEVKALRADRAAATGRATC
jgi:hypothetical protein